eukprot:2188112-Amphidinium_carterae.2
MQHLIKNATCPKTHTGEIAAQAHVYARENITGQTTAKEEGSHYAQCTSWQSQGLPTCAVLLTEKYANKECLVLSLLRLLVVEYQDQSNTWCAN